MAFQPGRSGKILVNQYNVSAYFKDLEYALKADTGDTSTFGGSWHTHLNLLNGAQIKVSGPFDPTAAGYLTGILGGASKNFVYGPMGTTSGNPRRTGAVILSEYNEKQSVNGLVEVNATFTVTNTVTMDTYP